MSSISVHTSPISVYKALAIVEGFIQSAKTNPPSDFLKSGMQIIIENILKIPFIPIDAEMSNTVRQLQDMGIRTTPVWHDYRHQVQADSTYICQTNPIGILVGPASLVFPILSLCDERDELSINSLAALAEVLATFI